MTPRLCGSCKLGEGPHELATGKYTVRNPDTGRIVFSGWLCLEHFTMYAEDGYDITMEKRRRLDSSVVASQRTI